MAVRWPGYGSRPSPHWPCCGEAFDVVVCDLPGGPSGPGRALGARLELLDWLVLAVTPEAGAVAATSHFLELFQTARDRGDMGAVRLAVVCTGDEGSAVMETAEVAAVLGVPVSGRIPQLWGRAVPNRGFGAALAIPELDDAVLRPVRGLPRRSRPRAAGSSRSRSSAPDATPSGRAPGRGAPAPARGAVLAENSPLRPGNRVDRMTPL